MGAMVGEGASGATSQLTASNFIRVRSQNEEGCPFDELRFFDDNDIWTLSACIVTNTCKSFMWNRKH